MDLPAFDPRNSGYNRMMLSNDYYAPVSPELMTGLYSRQAQPRHDPERSDMFSLGITMLCAATNEHFSTFYDFKSFQVRFDVISRKLNDMVNEGYTKLFVGTLSNLVHKDEGKRPSCMQLLNFIRANSEEDR